MTDYTKSTNFASKDSLPAGDALKIVKGTELDTEFTNIATAIATKADTVSPTFTGTPSGPTASVGTNTTQFATTALVFAVMQALYPVGSIYTSTVSTNPNTLFGFGTWSAYGAGRVLISAGGGFSAGATGGSADAIVVSHTHTATVTDPGHNHTFSVYSSQSDSYNLASKYSSVSNPASVTTASASTGISVSNSTTGSSGTNANLPPYIVVYMWTRTA
jgi:hypothetical protein